MGQLDCQSHVGGHGHTLPAIHVDAHSGYASRDASLARHLHRHRLHIRHWPPNRQVLITPLTIPHFISILPIRHWNVVQSCFFGLGEIMVVRGKTLTWSIGCEIRS